MRVHLQRLKGKLFKEERENGKSSMDVLDRPLVLSEASSVVVISPSPVTDKKKAKRVLGRHARECKKDAAPRHGHPCKRSLVVKYAVC